VVKDAVDVPMPTACPLGFKESTELPPVASMLIPPPPESVTAVPPIPVFEITTDPFALDG